MYTDREKALINFEDARVELLKDWRFCDRDEKMWGIEELLRAANHVAKHKS